MRSARRQGGRPSERAIVPNPTPGGSAQARCARSPLPRTLQDSCTSVRKAPVVLATTRRDRKTARRMATTSINAVETPAPNVRVTSEEVAGYARSASDALRLLAYSVVALALLSLTRWAKDTVLGFESDLAELVDVLDSPAERVLEGIAHVLVAIVGVGVFVVPIVLRRFRLLAYLVVANVVSGTLVGVAVAWLNQKEPSQIADELTQRAGLHLDGSLTPAWIAALAASFVILAPIVSARWRRAGALLVLLFVILRIILSVELPAELFLALAIGAASG